MINVIVSGSNGQVGSELQELAPAYPEWNFVFLDREKLPINDKEALSKIFATYHPQYFINCAAYTAVDKAEEERERAFEINGTAVGAIADLCFRHACRFIHISTDYVFDGESRAALKEEQATAPVNAYGKSKLLGEQLAQEKNPETIILRTSWVYSVYGKNFVKTMMRLMDERERLGVVNDQIGSPTYAADLAEAILQIMGSKKWVPGIYHFSNEGVISWFDFANEIKTLKGSSCTVEPIATADFPTPAKRPAYSVLDKTKIQNTFSIRLKNWKDSLKICVDKLKAS